MSDENRIAALEDEVERLNTLLAHHGITDTKTGICWHAQELAQLEERIDARKIRRMSDQLSKMADHIDRLKERKNG